MRFSRNLLQDFNMNTFLEIAFYFLSIAILFKFAGTGTLVGLKKIISLIGMLMVLFFNFNYDVLAILYLSSVLLD